MAGASTNPNSGRNAPRDPDADKSYGSTSFVSSTVGFRNGVTIGENGFAIEAAHSGSYNVWRYCASKLAGVCVRGAKGPNLSGITKPRIDEYMSDLLPKRDAVFAAMEKLAEKEDIPIIGPAVGRLLFLLTKVSRAKRIFEMGSAIGYSAIWFALATGAKGEIFYTEGDPRNEQRARRFAKRAGVEKRIKFMIGDALESFEKVPGKFHMVFIDVHKPQYPAALKMVVPRLERGGLLLADNTLWHGDVVKTTRDPSNRAIQQFNKMVYASRELFPVIVPLRDGLTICQKL